MIRMILVVVKIFFGDVDNRISLEFQQTRNQHDIHERLHYTITNVDNLNIRYLHYTLYDHFSHDAC